MKLYPVGGYVLCLNDDHKLPDIHKEHPFYDRIHAMVASIVLPHVEGVVVDVGANVGDTAAAFASVTDKKIICFEGASKYYEYLKHNVQFFSDQVQIFNKFVETEDQPISLYEYKEDNGSGGFKKSAAVNYPAINSVTVDDVIKLCDPDGIALLKSDTDGYDLAILSSFVDKLDSIMFFEYDVLITLGGNAYNRWNSFFSILESRNYSYIFFDNFGMPLIYGDAGLESAATQMHTYCHAQRLIRSNRMYYNDVWVFPQHCYAVYLEVIGFLNKTLLLKHNL